MKQKCYEINVMVRDFIIINFQEVTLLMYYTAREEGKAFLLYRRLQRVHRHPKIIVILYCPVGMVATQIFGGISVTQIGQIESIDVEIDCYLRCDTAEKFLSFFLQSRPQPMFITSVELFHPKLVKIK
jgi:hypothetical protein